MIPGPGHFPLFFSSCHASCRFSDSALSPLNLCLCSHQPCEIHLKQWAWVKLATLDTNKFISRSLVFLTVRWPDSTQRSNHHIDVWIKTCFTSGSPVLMLQAVHGFRNWPYCGSEGMKEGTEMWTHLRENREFGSREKLPPLHPETHVNYYIELNREVCKHTQQTKEVGVL